MKLQMPGRLLLGAAAALAAAAIPLSSCSEAGSPPEGEAAKAPQARPAPKAEGIQPLRPKGEDFAGPDGKAVRLWGMNLVAFYPEHALAEKTAANLAQLGFNIVRTHHNLRPSKDWNDAGCHALMKYEGDSRTPNPEAWDRFDYLNAKLKEKGIYLSLSIHWTRSYLPADGAILKVSEQDDREWAEAMKELNSWHWQKGFDPRKMLPVFDERCALLNEEFARSLLTHVNPYSKTAYGADPQVASIELINEFASEYTLVCKNSFPEYWMKRLNAKLAEFAKARGLAPFDLRNASSKEQLKCLAEFCAKIDADYAARMEKVIRACGYEGAIGFSNLWRGDSSLALRSKCDSYIEDHEYADPFPARDLKDYVLEKSKSALEGKPFVLGEFNGTENQKLAAERKSERSMLPLSAAAYGSLQNWSGIIWFAWCHGGREIGADGWGAKPSRESSIGVLANDELMLDHMRTAGIIFKEGMLEEAFETKTIAVDNPLHAFDYNGLMRGQYDVKPGWQSVHKIRKSFEAKTGVQNDPALLNGSPASPLVSDTEQIVKDVQRRQISFAAPKAEGFSGYLDGKAPAKSVALKIEGSSGFATVMAASLDGEPLAKAKRVILSKTYVDASGKESPALEVSLDGLRKGAWTMKRTRPSGEADVKLTPGEGGVLKIPASGWNEIELELN